MAFATRTRSGKWEIRESVRTQDGPRSRTLVTFASLTPDHVHLAVERAGGSLSADEVRAIARRAGAPVERPAADAAAMQLLQAVGRGDAISPGLRVLLRDVFSDGPISEETAEAIEHVGLSNEERAWQLENLLDFVDALPEELR